MPNWGAWGNNNNRTDRSASAPSINMSGSGRMRYARVVKVTHSTGVTPGTAEIAVSNVATKDEDSPVTLGRNGSLSETSMKYYSRVTIRDGRSPLFVGNLTKRMDSARSGITTLIYEDDRILLGKLPVRGAWVYDPYDARAKWVSRYLPVMNPGGYRNCTMTSVNGHTGKAPVFTWISEAGTAGRSSDEAGTGSDGEACFWTAERAIQYLRLCSTVSQDNTMRKIDPAKIFWSSGICEFGFNSRMKERIPETSLVGMSVLGAVMKIIDITGEYGFTMSYTDKGNVEFYSKDSIGHGIVFDMQVSGTASGFTGIHDYQVFTDASDVYTGCVTDGAPYQVESSFMYNPGGGDNGYGEDGTIVPAFTSDEAQAFRECVAGDGTHAFAPQDPSNPVGNYITLDGQDGNPTVLAKTMEAVTTARAALPKAYRAFKIPLDDSYAGGSVVAAKMYGVDGKWSAYQLLKIPRAPGPEQLQPYFEDAGDLRGRIRYPVRIRVATYDDQNEELHDVTANSGFRVTDDGLFWLDGLTDECVLRDRIYEGSFLVDPSDVKLRFFYVNCWLPGDSRIHSSQDIFGGAQDVRAVRKFLDHSVSDGTSKGMIYYVLAPDAYLDEHQVSSEPSPSGTVAGRIDKVAQPITGRLRFDDDQIEKHTERRLKDLTAIRRGGEYRFPTIRSDLNSGQMVKSIAMRGVFGKWELNRPISKIVFDFENQETSVSMED